MLPVTLLGFLLCEEHKEKVFFFFFWFEEKHKEKLGDRFNIIFRFFGPIFHYWTKYFFFPKFQILCIIVDDGPTYLFIF